MQDLLVMELYGGPWNGMYAAQFLSLIYAALMVIAIASAKDDGNSGVFPAAMAGIVPWVVMLSCVAYVETAMLLFTAVALVWAIRWIGREGADSWKAALISGVIAGLACGVKLTCVPMILVAIPVSLVTAFALARRSDRSKRKHCMRDLVVFTVIATVTLSPWLLRNFAWTGNPIFPLAMNLLGSGRFSAGQIDRFIAAHSPRADQLGLAARLGAVKSEILIHWQYGFLLVPLAVGLSIKSWRRPRVLFLLSALAINLVVWTFFTHLIGRFFLTSIPIAALLLGQINWARDPATFAAATLILIGQAAISFANIDSRLEFFCDLGRKGLFGIHDTNFVFSGELPPGIDPNRPIALLGDAGAFLYQIPMSRLKYQTVFNVPATDSQPAELRALLADWFGPDAILGSGDWIIILNPSEIERLSRTYRHVPGLPADYKGPRDQPAVLDGSKLGRTQP
jgi:hypothetical protein